MKCLVCGTKPLLVWTDSDKFDYICPAQHGPLGDVVFYSEIWDGERYVLTPVRPTAEEIAAWEKETAESADDESETSKKPS